MKEFNLEEAKAGKPVCTRDGKDVRILCFDRKEKSYCIAGLYIDEDGDEVLAAWTNEGRDCEGSTCHFDLMMVDEEDKPKHEFKPFDRVLVRDCDTEHWVCNNFSHYQQDKTYPYVCLGFTSWKQCIPFEGNEHLIGTTHNYEIK